MEPIDLLDVDYVIDTTRGTKIPPEEKRKVDHMFKIVIDGELFESKMGSCGECDIDTDHVCGIYAVKPFVCRTSSRPTTPIHLKRVFNGSN